MTLSEIKNILDAEVLCGEHLLGRKVKTAFACDLISEMLALANSNTLIITSLVNPHVIHTAEIMDAVGVIFVGGKKLTEDTIKKLDHGNIPVLSTPFVMFNACGMLFSNGIMGCMRGKRFE
ncbi:MAG TPA: DRTGG domain-containing protein [Syntrophorhabdaceae bacterium]|jgi:predicted transcriptional regulator|nr:DRTGG domain-containing protein [Syntrophorhabdaceae bacterium]HOS04886.1 DRTGG domain-containing protein [Syntrophorhabdaceae bacterium]HPL40288.1 DRTGG domain-containing protein [Syntrophorhabdaceae bacterium]